MRCNVTFRGNWAPSMKWHEAGSIVTAGNISTTVTSSHVMSVLTVKLNSNLNGGVFTCTTYFNESDNRLASPFGATNVPNYAYTWILSSKTEQEKKTSSTAKGNYQNLGVIIPKSIIDKFLEKVGAYFKLIGD